MCVLRAAKLVGLDSKSGPVAVSFASRLGATRKALLRVAVEEASRREGNLDSEAGAKREMLPRDEGDMKHSEPASTQTLGPFMADLLQTSTVHEPHYPSKGGMEMREVAVGLKDGAAVVESNCMWQSLRCVVAKQGAGTIVVACAAAARVWKSMVMQVHDFVVSVANDALLHGADEGSVPAEQLSDSSRGATHVAFASKTGRVVYTLPSAAPVMLRLRGDGASISTEPLEKDVEIEYNATLHGELEPRFERTRDIQYGARLPVLTPTPARPRVGNYRWVTRLGLPLSTFPKSGYMSMSEDMLGEFDAPVMHHWSPRSVDLHYGRLLSKDWMYNFVEHLGQRQILMFLHRRAAAMGFNLRLVTRTEVVPLYYEYAGTRTVLWHHFTLTRRLSLGYRVEFDADIRLCLNGAKRVHREIDAHFITLLDSGVAALHVEPWHRLVDNHEVGIVVDPKRGPSFNEECCRFHEAAPNTSLFAFDVEGDRVGDYLAVIGIKDELSGRFDVLMESAPYPILRGLFARPDCSFLVWGGKESAWLIEVGIPFMPEQLIDLQARYERPNDSLEGHHVGDDLHWVPPAKSRRIDEALWLLRADEHESIFAKSGCGNAFFFPAGPPPMPSIWSACPLAPCHVKYAAGDVIALFLLNMAAVAAAAYF